MAWKPQRGQSPPAGGGRALSLSSGPDSGFTLLELLVAIMFLSVGVLSLAQVFAVAQRHTAHAREETVASYLVQEIREKILSENYADVVSIFNGIDTDEPASITQPAEEWAAHVSERLGESGRGQIDVETEDDDPTLGHGLLRVVVTVSWLEGSNTVSFPLGFLIAKTGA